MAITVIYYWISWGAERRLKFDMFRLKSPEDIKNWDSLLYYKNYMKKFSSYEENMKGREF